MSKAYEVSLLNASRAKLTSSERLLASGSGEAAVTRYLPCPIPTMLTLERRIEPS
jgi:hypothetical protein